MGYFGCFFGVLPGLQSLPDAASVSYPPGGKKHRYRTLGQEALLQHSLRTVEVAGHETSATMSHINFPPSRLLSKAFVTETGSMTDTESTAKEFRGGRPKESTLKSKSKPWRYLWFLLFSSVQQESGVSIDSVAPLCL